MNASRLFGNTLPTTSGRFIWRINFVDNFITVMQGGSGWFAVEMWYNNQDDYGFWEPWQTGIGRYATREQAIVEAKQWAEDCDLEYRD
jgi:hypothetical protein